jgi:transposase
VRVGMEASGHGRWFERLLIELQLELWIGDAAEIRTKRVRKQKTDRQVSTGAGADAKKYA